MEEHHVKFDAAAFSHIIASNRSAGELGVAAKGQRPAPPPIDPVVYDGDTEFDELCMPESHEPSEGQGAAMQIAKEPESSLANEDDNNLINSSTLAPSRVVWRSQHLPKASASSLPHVPIGLPLLATAPKQIQSEILRTIQRKSSETDFSVLECTNWESRVQWDDIDNNLRTPSMPGSSFDPDRPKSISSVPISQIFQQSLSRDEAAKLLRLQSSDAAAARPMPSDVTASSASAPESSEMQVSPAEASVVPLEPLPELDMLPELAGDSMADFLDMVNTMDFGMDIAPPASASSSSAPPVVAVPSGPSRVKMSFFKPVRRVGSSRITNTSTSDTHFSDQSLIIQRNWGDVSDTTSVTNVKSETQKLHSVPSSQRAIALCPQSQLTDGSWKDSIVWSHDDNSMHNLSQLCVNHNDPFALSIQRPDQAPPPLPDTEINPNPLEVSGCSLKKYHQEVLASLKPESESSEEEEGKKKYIPNKKRDKERRLLREKQQRERLDREAARSGWSIEPVAATSQRPFNFSHDDFYSGTRRFAFNEILHSIPAIELDWKLFPTQWVDSTFPMWHRPPLFLGVPSANVPSVSASSAISALLQSRPEFNLTACDSTRDDLSSASVFVPKRVRHLSCTDNRVVLCEYVEQTPSMLNGAGMASHFITYYKKRNADDRTEPKVSDGHVLISDNENPFPLVKLPAGRPIGALANKMFAAPIAKHEVSQSDFLLSWTRRGWMIRPISSLYLVGQLHPRQPVPRPTVDFKFDHAHKRVSVWLQRHLNQVPDGPEGRDQRYAVSVDMLAQVAPELRDADLREVLSQHCDPIIVHTPPHPRREVWVRRADYRIVPDMTIQDRLKPEEVCLYEAMRIYELRLEHIGLRLRELRTRDAVPVHNAALKVPGSLKAAARFADLQLQLAPWNTSTNYIYVTNNQSAQIKLMGGGNPLARLSGFSYLHAPTRIEQKVMGNRTFKADLASQGVGDTARSLTGTEKDLRKLHIDELRKFCLLFGANKVDSEEIFRLERWPLVHKLRSIATKTVQQMGVLNAPELLVMWSRDDKDTRKERRDEYDEQVDQTFSKHIDLLSSGSAEIESNDESINSLARALESGWDEEGEADNNLRVQNARNSNAASAAVESNDNLVVLSVAGVNNTQPVSPAPTNKRRIKAVRWTRYIWDENSEAAHKVLSTDLVEPEAIDIFMRFRHDKNELCRRLKDFFGARLAAFMSNEQMFELNQITQTALHATNRKTLAPATSAQSKITNVKSAPSRRPAGVAKAKSSNVSCTRCHATGHMSTSRLCPMMAPEERDALEKRRLSQKVVREQETGVRQYDASTLEAAQAYLQADVQANGNRSRRRRGGRKDQSDSDDDVEDAFLDEDEDAAGGESDAENEYDGRRRSYAQPSRALATATPKAGLAGFVQQSVGGGLAMTINRGAIEAQQELKRKAEYLKRFLDLGRAADSSARMRGDCRLKLQSTLLGMLKALSAFDKHQASGLFSEPVNLIRFHDYEPRLTAAGLKPIDLSLIRCRVDQISYYKSVEDFAADVRAIRDNCAAYNGAESAFTGHATSLCDIVKILSDERREMLKGIATEIVNQDLFIVVLSRLRQHPNSIPFSVDPCKANGAEYSVKIRTPTFLGRIQDDVEACKIKTVAEFVLELQRMRANCETYWGVNSPYSEQGRQLVQLALDSLREFNISEQEWQSALDPRALTGGISAARSVKRRASALDDAPSSTPLDFPASSPSLATASASTANSAPKRPRTISIVPMGGGGATPAVQNSLAFTFSRSEPSPSQPMKIDLATQPQPAQQTSSLVEDLLPALEPEPKSDVGQVQGEWNLDEFINQ